MHGVHAATVSSALQLDTAPGEEVAAVLRSYAGTQDPPSSAVDTTFHKYIFDDGNLGVKGNKFLADVASIFQDNIKGVKEGGIKRHVDVGQDCGEASLYSLSQLSLPRAGGRVTRPRLCSTPTRGRDKSPAPLLDLSSVSSVSSISAVSSARPGPEGDSLAELSRDMFQSCVSEAGAGGAAISQQFLHTDREHEVTLAESRHASLLALAGQKHNQTSFSRTVTPDVVNTTYTISTENYNNFPTPMASSLTNISSITKNWSQLSKLEADMCDKFSNMSNSAVELVNMVTRETACKSSFNYLLLDPAISNNLPMRVFQEPDQELWRTFVRSVFYVGKGSRSRPFQHLYEAIKTFKKSTGKKSSDKIRFVQTTNYKPLTIDCKWKSNHCTL